MGNLSREGKKKMRRGEPSGSRSGLLLTFLELRDKTKGEN
jgi:hypothetical protein